MLPAGCESRCPGCAHRELSASESENLKIEWLGRALKSWKPAISPLRSINGEERWGYRQKTLLHAIRASEGWKFGMKIPGASRREFEIVPIPDCPVHSLRIRAVLKWLEHSMPLELKLSFVSISGSILTLVVKDSIIDELSLSRRLASATEEIEALGLTGIYLNVHPSAGRRVFSSSGWKLFWGVGVAENTFGKYGPQSFQQLIPSLYEDALGEAESWLAPERGSLVADLYSGLGVSLRRWKRRGATAVGVELQGESVRLSGDPDLLQGKVQERIPQLNDWLSQKRSRESTVLLFTNPPRTGMDDAVLSWIGNEVRPERVAYLSCSAGTLARDLSKLQECAYRVKRIIPYDFFPQTAHVETLACLELDPARGVSPSFSDQR